MAQKIDPATHDAPAAKAAAGADDLQILMPDADLTIAGETITVREYRFFDGLALRQQAAPFFDDLYNLLGREGAAPPSFDEIEMLVATHAELVKAMVALSVARTAEWVAALSETEGDALLITWWQVNSGFFIRRVMRRALQERLAAPSVGPASTTP